MIYEKVKNKNIKKKLIVASDFLFQFFRFKYRTNKLTQEY